MIAEQIVPQNEHNKVLMDALGFTPEDLQSNREGWLTERQRSPLEVRRNTWTGLRVILFAVSCVLSGINAINSQVWTIAVIWGIFVLFFLFSRWQMMPYVNDLRRGTVKVAEGRVKVDLSRHNQSGNDSYVLSTVNKRFYVKKTIADAFENAAAYRVYFTPKSEILLSAEWLRN